MSNPRLDLCSRQVFMHEELKDQVEINKIRNHFICKYIFLNVKIKLISLHSKLIIDSKIILFKKKSV